MRNKRHLTLRQTRKDVADLLRANKQENARIRVEAVIREINLLQAFEIMEIYLELLVVRLNLIEKSKDIPNDMFECLSSLVYAASRVQDFPELEKIRGLLSHKFGREYVEKASSDLSCRQYMVNENLIRCLAIGAPDQETKLQLLSEIAQEHEVEWDSHRAHQEMVTGGQRSTSFTNSPSGGGPPGFSGGFGGPGGYGGGGGGFGGGGGGGGNVMEPQSPIYAPPPGEMAPPQNFAPAPGPQESAFKKVLKKVPTMGRNSPQPPASPNIGGSAEWGDAQSAASAAREYSQNAQRAADAAHRYASSNASSGDLGLKGPSNTSPQPMRPNQQGAAPPSHPDYPQVQQGFGGPPPGGAQPRGATDYPDLQGVPPPEVTNFKPMSSNLPPGAKPTAPGGLPPRNPSPKQYRQRTNEEIQRDYDAAAGPPGKNEKHVGGPSAPPAPAQAREDTPGAGEASGTHTPTVPDSSKPASGPSDGGLDDDLLSRLAALKGGK